MALEKFSPCKVNLILNILRKRPDGFHELETVMHPMPVCDRLEFSRGSPGIHLTCSDPTLPTDQTNLVYRAAAAFLEKAALRDGVRIHLEKNIPMGAGLGGGSGNAAITLLGLNELFGAPLPHTALHSIAASLGSDIPFFLQSQPALATGRGEHIQPLDFFPALRGTALLLIYPGFGVPTAWAYQRLADFPQAVNGQPNRAQRLIAALQHPDLRSAAGEFFNSLEAPVLDKYPLLALYQEFLREQGALVALMSGSGSTTFAIASNKAEALRLEDRCQAKFGNCWTRVVEL